MAIDYGSFLPGQTADSVGDPQQLFQALPNKAKKYNYLRDVQGDVLSKWYSGKESKDTVIKMNTGGGKTTVGLLIAKSCINEGKGPSVYLCPDTYLVKQASKEAGNLGLQFTNDPRSPSFIDCKAILICTVQTLFNGKSKFGVGKELEIEIGALIFDDAHACLTSVEEQFSLIVDRENKAYKQLLALFEEDLNSQSASGTLELKLGHPGVLMQVPFFAWLDKQNDVLSILDKHILERERTFVWPLVKDSIAHCRCYFIDKKLEISGRCLPADVIPAFVRAKRRIYMTATLSDDSVLVTAFGSDEAKIANPIYPKTASDLGERMILAPQQINVGVKDEDIRDFLSTYSKTNNVVVIVPSHRRAKFWEPVATPGMILSAENIESGVAKLHSKTGQLAVLVNKYDGIDLPDDACRILVMDGLPDTRGLIDKYEQGTLISTKRFKRGQMQRLEQGMGRGIRSNEDYCVILLMGPQLLKVLYAATAYKYLSVATRKQLELSRNLATQLQHQGLKALKDPINDVLARNPNWIAASKNNLIGITYPTVELDQASLAQRKAFDAKRINQHEKAFKALQNCADSADDDFVKGWLLDQAAEALHPVDSVQSQTVLLAANSKNHTVTKPLKGLSYRKVAAANDQAREASRVLSLNYVDGGNDVVIAMNGLLDDLTFKDEGSDAFEEAMYQIGQHLGFKTQRPEKEGGGKLDVLWVLGKYRYAMFACKSESGTERISKQYADQLSGNANWFSSTYGAECHAFPVVVHPSDTFESDASPPVDTRVLDRKVLKNLKKACMEYASAVKDRIDDVEFLKDTLEALGLSANKFVTTFTVACKQKKI